MIKEIVEIYEVTPRRFQILVKEYKETRIYLFIRKEKNKLITIYYI